MESQKPFMSVHSLVFFPFQTPYYTGAINHTLLKYYFAWPPCGYLVNKQMYEPFTLISLSKRLCFL